VTLTSQFRSVVGLFSEQPPVGEYPFEYRRREATVRYLYALELGACSAGATMAIGAAALPVAR
jgi:hypothetical protein